MVNIADIKPSERDIEMLNPADDEPVGIRCTIVSGDDPRLKSIKRQIQDAGLKSERTGKVIKAAKAEEQLNILLAETITKWDWYGDIDLDGKKPECNLKNKVHVISEFPWFKRQLDEEVANEKAFFHK